MRGNVFLPGIFGTLFALVVFACTPGLAGRSPERAGARSAVVGLANATRIVASECHARMVDLDAQGHTDRAIALGERCELSLQCAKTFIVKSAELIDNWDDAKPGTVACGVLHAAQCLEGVGLVLQDDTLTDAVQFAKGFSGLCPSRGEKVVVVSASDAGADGAKEELY